MTSWLGVQGCGDDAEDSATPQGEDGAAGAGGVGAPSSGGAGAPDSDPGGTGGIANPGTPEGGVGGGDGGDREGGDGGAAEPSGAAGHDGGSGGETGSMPTSFLPLYENGTRLRAVTLGAVGSSTRRFLTWYDTELEAECEFLRAEDGEYRCVPHAHDLGSAFLDADCTEPVHYDPRVSPCSNVPAFRRESVSVNGCSTVQVIRLEPVDTNAIHSACNGVPAELPDGATVWRDVEVVDPEMLVKATERVRVDDRGFGVRELVGEDGSRQVTSMADAEHGPCAARDLSDAGLRCLPSNTGYLDSPWWFADPDCEAEPLAYASRCAPPAKFALDLTPPIDDLPSVLRIGEAVTGTVYERSFVDGECVARDTAEIPWALYRIEGDYDATQFLPLTTVPGGEGPLRTLHHAVDGEPLTPLLDWPPLFYDADAEATCGALQLGDEHVCVPAPFMRREVLNYADEDCSEPITYLAGDEPPAHVVLIERTFCSRRGFDDRIVTTYAVRETYSGPVYEDLGGCVEVEPVDLPYYRLEAIEPDFPILDEVIE
ncbi:MAG: hypothetical protein DIU78_014890 [Pseudomonadota bacterium]